MPYNYNYNNYKVKQNKSFTRWVEDNLFDISIFSSVIARLIMSGMHLFIDQYYDIYRKQNNNVFWGFMISL